MPAQNKLAVVTDFRRTQILEAARRTFARHGLGKTTVSHIAAAAGVAKGTVYLYYRSKDDILDHALSEGLADLHRETVPAIAGPGSLEHKLAAFFRGMLGYVDRHREFIELCHFDLGSELRRSARQKFGQVYAAQVSAWRKAIRAAAHDQDLTHVDPKHGALIIVSLAHGLAIQRLRGWTRSRLEEDVSRASAMVWKGLLTR